MLYNSIYPNFSVTMQRQSDIYSGFSEISNYLEISEIKLVISKIRISDIRKSRMSDIRKSNQRYQNCIKDIKNSN